MDHIGNPECCCQDIPDPPPGCDDTENCCEEFGDPGSSSFGVWISYGTVDAVCYVCPEMCPSDEVEVILDGEAEPATSVGGFLDDCVGAPVFADPDVGAHIDWVFTPGAYCTEAIYQGEADTGFSDSCDRTSDPECSEFPLSVQSRTVAQITLFIYRDLDTGVCHGRMLVVWHTSILPGSCCTRVASYLINDITCCGLSGVINSSGISQAVVSNGPGDTCGSVDYPYCSLSVPALSFDPDHAKLRMYCA